MKLFSGSWKKLWFIICMAIFSPGCDSSPPTIAGGSGSETLLGEVIDAQGYPVNDATVILKSISVTSSGDSTITEMTTKSDPLGEYSFEDVPYGTYIVHCQFRQTEGMLSRLHVKTPEVTVAPVVLR